MSNDIEKILMFSFLKKNFPVSRIKSNGRFKRGIILNDGSQHILNSTSHNIPLKENLINVLIKVFSCDPEMAKETISNFLNYK